MRSGIETSGRFVQVDRIRMSGKVFGALSIVEETFPSKANPSGSAEIPNGIGEYYDIYAKGILRAAEESLPLVRREFSMAQVGDRKILVPMENQTDFSLAEVREEALYSLIAIEQQINSASLEILADPRSAARLGLAWAESDFKYSIIILSDFVRGFSDDTEEKRELRQRNIKRIEELRDALIDARNGHYTYLKEEILDHALSGALVTLTGQNMDKNMAIIALAMPNEISPEELTSISNS